MTTVFHDNFDALSRWRKAKASMLIELNRFLVEHELSDAAGQDLVASLRERLAGDKLVVAFVAEFSRGKSELINAIFFADAGRRVLPAAPGRTTMCPVELGWDAGSQPSLSLLPIESRLVGPSVADLRGQSAAWTHITLAGCNADQLADALTQVVRTQWVTHDEARALGFWDEAQSELIAPRKRGGRVEVPVWRHALINYPHPLLQRGLVVIDTPGLNAIGAEPELTLGLLPSAHATVFILGADTGVSQSDMTIWRDHLGPLTLSRFVVLNKIDTLRDPLLTPRQVSAQIEAQREAAAATLGVEVGRVFPLSAREALVARSHGDATALQASRLPALESALATQLLAQRHGLLQDVVCSAADRLEGRAVRRVGERRRQVAEQMLELRGLRGKSGARLRSARDRVEAEAVEFEQCVVRLRALRAVHARMLKEVLDGLGSDRLRTEVLQFQQALQASMFKMGAKKAFTSLCGRLRQMLLAAGEQSNEIHAMLGATYARLNAEFGFGLQLGDPPDPAPFEGELQAIERSYLHYLGPTHALRLANPAFMDQFRRMLVSKLRGMFETVGVEIERWNRTASAQLDMQLRERRRSFQRRREALERVAAASGELEGRIGELEAQDVRLRGFLVRVGELAAALRQPAPAEDEGEITVPAVFDTIPFALDTAPDPLPRLRALA